MTPPRKIQRNRKMPVVMIDGVMRPDQDRRWVPSETMAEYLDVASSTLYRWLCQGSVPKNAVKKFGKTHRYMPCIYLEGAK